jgi:aspartate aminotransferase-like enzyme
MASEDLLLIPGPTNLSQSVRDAMARPQISHIGPEFYSAFKEIVALVRYAFKNERGYQFVFTGSGTVGMESTVVSLVGHGDRTLTVCNGYFGKRMLMLNQVHGAKADALDYADGCPANPDDLRKKLRSARYKAVFITHVDTSTSIVNPIEELVEECKKAGVLSVIDSVCGVGGEELDFDALGADIAFTASQKAIAGPPGAVMVAASSEALDYLQKREGKIESYYMNLLRWKPIMEDPRIYLATPAVQVLLAVREALRQVKEEGLEKRWERHRALGSTVRSRLSDLGTSFVAEEGFRADTVTSFWVKRGTAGNIQKTLEERHHTVVARGVSEARDTMVRIGHFGILTVDRLRSALDSVDQVLLEEGVARRKGAPLARQP